MEGPCEFPACELLFKLPQECGCLKFSGQESIHVERYRQLNQHARSHRRLNYLHLASLMSRAFLICLRDPHFARGCKLSATFSLLSSHQEIHPSTNEPRRESLMVLGPCQLRSGDRTAWMEDTRRQREASSALDGSGVASTRRGSCRCSTLNVTQKKAINITLR